MKLRTKLLAIARVVAAEAEKNAPFRKALENAIDPIKKEKPSSTNVKRPSNRRTKAKVDPLQIAKESGSIRPALDDLSLEELRDVVAEFAMDPSKLVMKWKDRERVIDHIIETTRQRAAKGSAFRR